MDTVEEYLTSRETEYQACQATIEHILKVVNHQKEIRKWKTIPKQYKPKQLEVVTTNASPTPLFQDKFNRDFERLFFSNLNRTIDHNTVVLITTEVTCIGLLDSIDHELCRRRDSPTVVGGALHSFINRLKINHNFSPTLQQILDSTSSIPSLLPRFPPHPSKCLPQYPARPPAMDDAANCNWNDSCKQPCLFIGLRKLCSWSVLLYTVNRWRPRRNNQW